MKRTKFPKGMKTAVNYYDKEYMYRWGLLVKEGQKEVVVVNVFGEKTSVPKDKIIKRQTVEKWGFMLNGKV